MFRWLGDLLGAGKRNFRQTLLIKLPITVYSHRGGPLSSGFTENTLPAFRYSAALGVDLLELDVQLTRDGQVVVFHDAHLGRMCGKEYQGRRVSDYAYDQLPHLLPPPAPPSPPPIPPADSSTVGGLQHPQQQPAQPPNPPHSASQGGASQPSQQWVICKDDLTRIPLLEQVFREFPQHPVQVDVKVATPGLAGAVHDLITAHHRQGHTLWGSFNGQVNAALYAKDSTIPLFTCAWRAIMLRAAFALGVMSRVPIHESAIIVPYSLPTPFGTSTVFFSQPWFEALKQRGVATVVYGRAVNDADAFGACVAAGVDGICTDHPLALQAYLRGQPAPGSAAGAQANVTPLDSSEGTGEATNWEEQQAGLAALHKLLHAKPEGDHGTMPNNSDSNKR